MRQKKREPHDTLPRAAGIAEPGDVPQPHDEVVHEVLLELPGQHGKAQRGPDNSATEHHETLLGFPIANFQLPIGGTQVVETALGTNRLSATRRDRVSEIEPRSPSGRG